MTFERMFGEAGSSGRRLAQMRRKQSLLDSVVEEAKRMRSSLGSADGAILDEYLTNIRDVELTLDRMDARAANVPEGAPRVCGRAAWPAGSAGGRSWPRPALTSSSKSSGS